MLDHSFWVARWRKTVRCPGSIGDAGALCAQGIVFSVRPPKKSWKNIANLSGGEKTLSSLSLVFALHHYKPTPLYVMDEIDAALGGPS